MSAAVFFVVRLAVEAVSDRAIVAGAVYTIFYRHPLALAGVRAAVPVAVRLKLKGQD